MKNYHYVYRITNVLEGKHYYGVRSTDVHPVHDLGVEYFSSSKDKEFIKEQKKNPHNFKYKIVKIYSDRKTAVQLEIDLHNKFDVGTNESFYNRCKQTSVGWDTTGISYPKSEETRKKLSEARKGRVTSLETRKKLSEASNVTTKVQWKNYTEEQYKKHCESVRHGNKRYYDSLSDKDKEEHNRHLKEWKLNNPDKVKDNLKRAAEKRRGANNGSARRINIFNADGKLMFECHGNYQVICEEHGIPSHKIKESYLNNGKPLYTSAYGQTVAKQQGLEQFIGWYAKYNEGNENE